MGQKQNRKYHITNTGDVYRVNDDGSFTSMGNAEEHTLGNKPSMDSSVNYADSSTVKNYDLQKLENRIINSELCDLTLDEVKYIARKSQNSDALLRASEFDDTAIIPIIVERFENGATFLENAILNGCQYDRNDAVRLAIAKCKRRFDDCDILTTLGKDKNPMVSDAAKSNPNYTGKTSGCLGSIMIFVITTLSFVYYIM